MARSTVMSVECRTCPVRELHCSDCMVPVLLALQAPPESAPLDAQERSVVTRLVGAGLVDLETASTVRARLNRAPMAGEGRDEGGRAIG
jgi:hypothetical protein